jgi:hypothetical protein
VQTERGLSLVLHHGCGAQVRELLKTGDVVRVKAEDVDPDQDFYIFEITAAPNGKVILLRLHDNKGGVRGGGLLFRYNEEFGAWQRMRYQHGHYFLIPWKKLFKRATIKRV